MPAWRVKLHVWSKWPLPPQHYFDVRILNTRTFAEESRWRIGGEPPYATWNWPYYEDSQPPFTWSAEGDRLFLTSNGVLEVWPVPPHALGKSMGNALLATTLLGVFWYTFRYWRKRKRATIAPIPAPAKMP